MGPGQMLLRTGARPWANGGTSPLSIHSASPPSVPTWPSAWPHPRRPLAPQVCTLASLALQFSASGSSGLQLLPSALRPPTRPLNPLGLPISASLPPQPPFSTPSGSSAPRFLPIRLRSPPEPHSSAVSPPVPCPGLPHPREPQGLTCYSATPCPSSRSRRPRPLPVPRRRGLRAGAVGPRAGGVGPLLPPGGLAALSTQRVARHRGPHPGFWSKTRDHWRIASLLEPWVVGRWGQQSLPHSAQTLSNMCCRELVSSGAGMQTQTAPEPAGRQARRHSTWGPACF